MRDIIVSIEMDQKNTVGVLESTKISQAHMCKETKKSKPAFIPITNRGHGLPRSLPR